MRSLNIDNCNYSKLVIELKLFKINDYTQNYANIMIGFYITQNLRVESKLPKTNDGIQNNSKYFNKLKITLN